MHDSHRIQKLTTGGKFLHKFGKEGSGKGQFRCPNSVVVDSKNRVIVSDRDNSRVQVFSQDGDCLRTIDGTGSGDNFFQSPRGLLQLSLDPQGNIHVHTVGNLNKPCGVALDPPNYGTNRSTACSR